MKRLCQRLKIPQYAAVGILESLWHLTAKEAPQGDIGKLSNEDIALGLDWRGDPGKLVTSLLSCHWLDDSPTHRLVVHDWHEHADEAVKKRMVRNHLSFLSVSPLSRHVQTPAVKGEKSQANGSLPEPEPVPEPEHEPVAGATVGHPPDSADARILCEVVGIFPVRQQEEIHRLMVVHAKTASRTGEECIAQMSQRWAQYQVEAPTLEWQYGSAHKFFMSGKWDDPRSWPRGVKNGTRGEAEARWEAHKAQEAANETA
jgi:hypothetical protein